MLYNGYRTDRDRWNNTPLMLWVKYRPGEAIPKELFYNGYQTDRDIDGDTPLMNWILYRPGSEPIP